ncbi:hypothetical protein FFWV33_17755 [Flavobacterium faecale]|uniref:Uncharacterized protein n=1 Tax=Flavobacterium faecale TaxID=1355330 RepID=A0A2S1LHH4_9FLAO|nr:hypothetical protein [Flavobacterium faecale]AWG23240.1 hypothetical protein FFWV33_17755 [Flavobacterium faecale]
MKKLASLFLTFTLFYNVFGFYMMFADQKEQTWVAAMENTQNSDFKIFKVKINPYAYIVDSGFEYVNEDVVVKNTTFHVFKNRIQNNVLELYCLKKVQQNGISAKIQSWVDHQLFGHSSNNDSPIKKILKSFIKDYLQNDTLCYQLNYSQKALVASHAILPKSILLSGYYTVNHPPPNFI